MNGTRLHTVLRSTGSYVPARVVTNADFVALDTSDEWIRSRTGIRERRYIAPGESSASMGVLAGRQALERAGLHATDIDLVVCATVTPDLMTPSCANMIQVGLGCRTIPSFDLTAACTGFLYAASVADQYIRTGTAKNILVVGAETVSRAVDHGDRNTCILFGDGAGAAVLTASESDQPKGLHNFRLYSDAGGAHLISVPSAASSTRKKERRIEFLEMSGREVYRFAISRMVELIEQARIDSEQTGRPIDLLIPHQVNRRIIDAALESTGFPLEKVILNLDKYGNTSAASIPIALDEAIREGRARPGDNVLFVAFGGGLTWGSAMLSL